MRLRRRNSGRRSQSPSAADGARMAQLERRLEHLEKEFEGLQDSVYRAHVRQDKQIQELVASTQPGAMGRALSDDARRRGV